MPTVSQKAYAVRQTGFSLVELLVVVMVILVIAAIAIPSMVQARMQANEAAAVASMRTIQTAEVLYASEFPDEGYAPSLPQLGPNGSDCDPPGRNNSCIIMDEALINGAKNGYVFQLSGDGKKPSANYTVKAVPASAGFSGRCGFSSGQSGDIMKISPTGSGAGRLAISSSGGCD